MATTMKIPEAAVEILRRSTITATTVILPPGQLDRKLYEQFDKALRAAGGKWDRRQRLHEFTEDPRQALGLTLVTGEAVNQRQLKQAFYTPDPVAVRLVARLNLQPGHRILEPSCGDGSLIRAVLKAQPRVSKIVGIDTDAKALDKVEKDPRIHLKCCDFLTVAPKADYDCIPMNPPFTRGSDAEHVVHAVKFLRSGGRLAAITSCGWETGKSKKAQALRAMLDQYDWKTEKIAPGAFKSSGTSIGTVLLTIVKS